VTLGAVSKRLTRTQRDLPVKERRKQLGGQLGQSDPRLRTTCWGVGPRKDRGGTPAGGAVCSLKRTGGRKDGVQLRLIAERAVGKTDEDNVYVSLPPAKIGGSLRREGSQRANAEDTGPLRDRVNQAS